jgi:ankyrin repeat protein
MRYFFSVLILAFCLLAGGNSVVFAGPMDELLINSVNNNDKVMVKIALERGANINYSYETGAGKITALRLVLTQGKVDMLRFLLDNGADPNETVGSGVLGVKLTTSLIYCQMQTLIEPRNLEMTQLLVAAGADVNAADEIGNTPLIVASMGYNEKIDVVNFLLSKGAGFNHANKFGQTALMLAADKPMSNKEKRAARIAIAKRLLQAGADPTIMDDKKMTALHYAVKANFPEMVSLLLPLTPQ